MKSNSESMKKGRKKDDIGRLDHTKESDNRAKNKRDLQKELDMALEDNYIDIPNFLK